MEILGWTVSSKPDRQDVMTKVKFFLIYTINTCIQRMIKLILTIYIIQNRPC